MLAGACAGVLFRDKLEFYMAKTTTRNSRYREDLTEMPDWLKKKKCPNRDKYMSGKRILPKNLTGKEKLAGIIDETFLAYNSARLK